MVNRGGWRGGWGCEGCEMRVDVADSPAHLQPHCCELLL